MNSQLETVYRYVESRLRKRNIVMLEQDEEAKQRILNELEKMLPYFADSCHVVFLQMDFMTSVTGVVHIDMGFSLHTTKLFEQWNYDKYDFVKDKEEIDELVDIILETTNDSRTSGHKDGEIKGYLAALSVDDRNEIAWTRLGRFLREQNKLDKATECYNMVLRINPNCAVVYGNIGALYIVKQEYVKAEEYLRKASSLMSETDVDYPIMMSNYAVAVGKQGDKKQANKLLKMAEKQGYKNGKKVRELLGIKLFGF